MRPSFRGFSWIPLAALAAGPLAGCGNPAVDVRIEALGGEQEGVEPGEFHRAGQPCVLCHSKYGGAEPMMSVGGTIFASPGVLNDLSDLLPVEGIKVLLRDADGTDSPVKTTNCIGNFFITTDEWNPSFPLHVELEYTLPNDPEQKPKRTVMRTRISRDGSCAGCHVTAPPNQGSPGVAYVLPAPSPFPPPGKDCQGLP